MLSCGGPPYEKTPRAAAADTRGHTEFFWGQPIAYWNSTGS